MLDIDMTLVQSWLLAQHFLAFKCEIFYRYFYTYCPLSPQESPMAIFVVVLTLCQLVLYHFEMSVHNIFKWSLLIGKITRLFQARVYGEIFGIFHFMNLNINKIFICLRC